MQISALASWFGSNRMLGEHVGKALKGCEWVGVPFMGGGSELAHIQCRTGVANDLHKHVINLARVAASRRYGPALWRKVRRVAFHPGTLAEAQELCRYAEGMMEGGASNPQDEIEWAAAYFICVWMARNGTAGTDGEFRAGVSYRWEAGGGDSVKRFRSAAESLKDWRSVLAKWTFTCMDVFKFLEKCHDKDGHGLYLDPPFPGPGDGYKHKFTTEQHRRLADTLAAFKETRVVCRFYDVPLIRELYPEPLWDWNHLVGRKATNDAAPEVLLIRNPA